MAKRKEKLSASKVTSVTPEEKRFEIYDTVRKGLILRVTPKGSKSFAYRYWYDGKSTQRTIGSVDNYTLAEARAIAEGWRKMLDIGKNPITEKEDNKEANSLGEYINQFKADYLKRKLKQSTQKTYTARLNKVLNNRIANLPLNEITRSDVRKFLKAEASSHPTNANRLHSILSKVFNEAIEDGELVRNPIKDMEKISDETKRDPHYSTKDVLAIWDAISNEWQPMQGLLKILIITGQRLGETSRMKWKDVNNDVWIIPIAEQKTGKKTKRNHTVPLSNLALDVLDRMESVNGSSEYVFASLRDKGKPLSHFKNAIDRIREQTGLSDFRIHDLRHIVATEMIKLDVPFTTVGRVLNHKALAGENSITARYINTDLTKQKTIALTRWASELQRIVAGESAKVLKIG